MNAFDQREAAAEAKTAKTALTKKARADKRAELAAAIVQRKAKGSHDRATERSN
jgi:hypothetical protein